MWSATWQQLFAQSVPPLLSTTSPPPEKQQPFILPILDQVALTGSLEPQVLIDPPFPLGVQQLQALEFDPFRAVLANLNPIFYTIVSALGLDTPLNLQLMGKMNASLSDAVVAHSLTFLITLYFF